MVTPSQWVYNTWPLRYTCKCTIRHSSCHGCWGFWQKRILMVPDATGEEITSKPNFCWISCSSQILTNLCQAQVSKWFQNQPLQTHKLTWHLSTSRIRQVCRLPNWNTQVFDDCIPSVGAVESMLTFIHWSRRSCLDSHFSRIRSITFSKSYGLPQVANQTDTNQHAVSHVYVKCKQVIANKIG